MKKLVVVFLCICFLFNAAAFAGIDGKSAAYIGGSTKDKDFPGAKDSVEGKLDMADEVNLKFNWGRGSFAIPYDKIIDLEYGQKAGRRVGAAIATAILLSPVGLFLLFSKKRKHYVTIGYHDGNGKEQVAVFELGKDIVRTALPTMEARSGKKITYQDEDAKKASKGN